MSGSEKGEESEVSEYWEEAEGEVTVVGANCSGKCWERELCVSDFSESIDTFPSKSKMTEASGRGSGTGDLSQILVTMLQQQAQQREEDNRRMRELEESRLRAEERRSG